MRQGGGQAKQKACLYNSHMDKDQGGMGVALCHDDGKMAMCLPLNGGK